MKIIIKLVALLLIAAVSAYVWFWDIVPTQKQAVATIQHPDWVEFVEPEQPKKPDADISGDQQSSLTDIPVGEILSQKNQLLYNAIIKGIEEGETQVKVENTDYTEDSVQEIMNYMGFKNPEYFWISYFETHFIIDSFGTTVNLTYNYSGADLEQKKQQFNAAIDQAVNATKAQNFSTQYETAVFIYEYLIRNITYDYTLSKTDIHNAYGALVNKTAVCDGYALAFSLIAEQLGIDSYVILGDDNNPDTEEGHAWNKVMLDGVITNIDATWDDLDLETNLDPEYSINAVSHMYFGLSEKQFEADHIIDEDISVMLPDGVDINWYDKNGFVCASPSEITDKLAATLCQNINENAGYFEVKITDPEAFTLFTTDYTGGVDAIIEAANEIQEQNDGPLFQTTATFPITHQDLGTVLVVCPIEE